MRRPRLTVGGAAALAAAVLVSGCGVDVEPTRGQPPAARPGASTTGVLRVGITAPGRIDPIGAATPGARMITQAMCDTLVTIDPVTRQVRPGLAKATVEADNGSFVTVMPLHDQRFPDGSVLRSGDVNASLKALAAVYNGSAFRASVRPFTGGVLGSGDATTGDEVNPLLADGSDGGIEPAQALNDYDVQLKATPANSAALRLLADPSMAPVSAAAMTRDIVAFQADPACVGPYRLAAPHHPQDTAITLVRNADYAARNLAFSAGGAGYVDKIVFTIYPDDAAAYRAYAAGREDLVRLPEAMRRQRGSITGDLITGVAPQMEYLGMVVGRGTPTDRPVVRRALSMALDRSALAAADGYGTAAATGFFPPSLSILPGAEPAQAGLSLPTCDAVSARPQVAAARALLAQSGVSLRGQVITLTYDQSATTNAMAEKVAAQWKAAFGVQVRTEPTIWSLYVDAAPSFDGAFRMVWSTAGVVPVPGIPEIQSYVQQVFTSAAVTGLKTGWVDAGFDRGVRETLAKTDDQRTRGKVVQQLAATLCAQMPYVPTMQRARPWVLRRAEVASARPVAVGVDGLPVLRELYRIKPRTS